MQRIPPYWFPRAIAVGLLCAVVGAVTWTALWAAGLLIAIVAVIAKVVVMTFEDFSAARGQEPWLARVREQADAIDAEPGDASHARAA